MIRILLNIIFIGVLFSATSYDTYSVILKSKKDLDRITQAGAIIDHYHNGNEVHILATESQYYTIINDDINIKKVENKARQYYLELLE